MIAKTVTGSDFTGALEYGAGIRSDRTNKQAELLSVANLGSEDAAGIAAEMRDVAAMSSRILQPVWHTILSWAPGEQVSREQKLRAAASYCELMGAGLDRHQVAVYEHKDKDHPHVHIYINRVPIDGGPALRTDQNYARNVAATRKIRAQLGLPDLPKREHTTRALDPAHEATRAHVRQALGAALASPNIRSLDQLVEVLRQQQIEPVLKRDAKGVLVGTSFRYQDASVKGTDVGVKARQLREYFGPASQRLAPSAPATEQALVTQGGPLLRLEQEPGEGAGVDDATQNLNRRRRIR
jgi:hypothetical protein